MKNLVLGIVSVRPSKLGVRHTRYGSGTYLFTRASQARDAKAMPKKPVATVACMLKRDDDGPFKRGACSPKAIRRPTTRARRRAWSTSLRGPWRKAWMTSMVIKGKTSVVIEMKCMPLSLQAFVSDIMASYFNNQGRCFSIVGRVSRVLGDVEVKTWLWASNYRCQLSQKWPVHLGQRP